MIISNTQVTSYNLCTQQEHYRFVLGVEPRTFNLNITRGLIAHEALEQYYLLMKEGASVDICYKAARDILEKHLRRICLETPEEFEQISMIKALIILFEAYTEYYKIEPFKVLEVEKVFTTSIDNVNSYGMKLDLLVEFTLGPYKGDLAIYDHKTVYNFKTQKQLEMNGQLPKYIKTVRNNGYYVTKGFLNQIRHRPMKNPQPSDVFQRTPIRTTPKEIEQIWNEQREAAIEIATNRAKPRRTLSEIVCRSCYFEDICKAELMGNDISTMLEINYKPNTYGYVDINEGS